MKNKNLLTVAALFLLLGNQAFAQVKEDNNAKSSDIDEVVITGTLKEVKKSDSPVPVTIVSSKIFQKSPTSNVVDALYQVNGITPQVNCNMCNTSDIGINGMPGPYTMVLIDGMPIVSSLATVYGFSGIPNSIIQQIEVVKGPASSLYGSDAIGGVINIITKKSTAAPKLFIDYNSSTWQEHTGNIGFSAKLNNNISTMFNVDGYYYNTPKDILKDGFMDKTLQKRVSVFNKWDFKQKYDKTASISLRYYNEDRHGGEMGWDKNHRGYVDFLPFNDDKNSEDYNLRHDGFTDNNINYAKGFRIPKYFDDGTGVARLATQEDIDKFKADVLAANPNAKFAENMKYQEAITTKRFEAIGKWQLPIEENITIQASYNKHDQSSAYGTELFEAHQNTLFGQIYWNKNIGNHDLLAGATSRYTSFTDNTIASANGSIPFTTFIPGIFIQDLWKTSDNTSLLLGYRLDYDKTRSANGNHDNIIHSPRIAFKYFPNSSNTLRASIGTGYHTVNIFSEDHKALRGQYKTKFAEQIQPEKSVSGTLDYEGRIATENIGFTYNIGAYYTHFFNKIYYLKSYEDKTLTYRNVTGKEYARNYGASLDIALNFNFPLRLSAGVTYNNAKLFEFERDEDGKQTSDNIKPNDFQYVAKWLGVYSASYDINKHLTVDLTGNWKGPVLLPTQGDVDITKGQDSSGNPIVVGKETDPRPAYSPYFTKLNLQFTYKIDKIQIYGGVKNMFNYIPTYALVNTADSFNDRQKISGGLQFDAEYNYTPQQGRIGYLGLRYSF